MKEQATSGDAWSCCEAGEERLAKGAVPTVIQVQQTAGYAQDLPTLPATVFPRADGAQKAVPSEEGIVLAQQLQPCPQRGGLSAQEEQEPPERGAVERSFVDLLLSRRRDVAPGSAARCHDLLIGEVVPFQVNMRQGEEAEAGVAPVGQQESRADR